MKNFKNKIIKVIANSPDVIILNKDYYNSLAKSNVIENNLIELCVEDIIKHFEI